MRLTISHVTSYNYDQPVPYALQQLRLTPKTTPAQKVVDWRIEVSGGTKELSFEDAHRNTVTLIGYEPGATAVSIRCSGEVELSQTHGVVGAHGGFMPLWMFDRTTARTRPGPLVRKLVQGLDPDLEPLPRLHALMGAVHGAIEYVPGASHVDTTAEEALAEGRGVCQDHAHAFIAAARAMGVPARYVSGYLMLTDRVEQDATHAWAEAHVPGLGWVGFDAANDVCPDTTYVRVATGLDYAEAAPVSGMRFGAAGEKLSVQVQVQQQ
ncbi:MAG: transglutaminase family protein [Limimaricola sp.]|uniref:transglutaminase family protein n=1 Tax=Limimaricola sp. TaxID=2211665 RepID=UPI001DB955CF|nr:transglutaminase family protein [Limimaricola sp.]MBI1418904.1 transglutaminase family protein [Limimaricola sp.]